MTEKQAFSIQRWQGLICKCKQSGMRVQDWCVANGVTKDEYYYWLRKIRALHYDKAVSCLPAVTEQERLTVSTPSSYVEITPSADVPQSEAAKGCEKAPAAILVDGIRIELSESATTSIIARILEAARYAQA